MIFDGFNMVGELANEHTLTDTLDKMPSCNPCSAISHVWCRYHAMVRTLYNDLRCWHTQPMQWSRLADGGVACGDINDAIASPNCTG